MSNLTQHEQRIADLESAVAQLKAAGATGAPSGDEITALNGRVGALETEVTQLQSDIKTIKG